MENTYNKIITLKGYYFTKEYEKTKKNTTKTRTILEETVRKFFKQGSCDILVIFEESGKQIRLTKDSPREEIIKYLGKKFLG
ncbi:hypothetical protein [Filifactor villosus]|uniref:Uncharacterized protein n=1 Tax=Filifactor villosus TaxID=29374 RepID=A0ABV9QJM7_9FIRM